MKKFGRCFRKTAAVLLSAAMAAGLVTAPASAATNYKEYDIYVERPASEGDTAAYHGAKYEPKTGCYLGMFAEGDTGMHNWDLPTSDGWYFGGTPRVTGKQHAAYMLYVHYQDDDAISHYSSHLKAAAELGKGIQICLEPGNGLDEVQDNAHLYSLASQARDAGIPIFLRFANEFNEESNLWYGDTAKYIEKYRLVANAFHSYAPNVAMVWSPNDWPIGNEHEYYPGDEYVDWVGVSSYPIYNSDGSPKQGNTWVDRFREIYDSYGWKKPIMISEGAPSATVEYHPEQDTSWFAAYEIQRFYASIARRYPNVKMIFYWSENEEWGRLISCELSKNPALLNAYKSAISDPYFLGEMNSNSTVCYKKVSDVTLKNEVEKLSCYINDVNNRCAKAVYYIDGKYAGEGYFPEYTASINLSAYSGKNIKLRTDFYNESDSFITSKEISVKVAGDEAKKASPSVAKVMVDGVSVSFDAYNIDGNNYFKLRDLAMAINSSTKGFEVSWNAEANAISLISNTAYTPVGGELAAGSPDAKVYIPSTSKVIKDGTAINLKAYNISGNNYFKLRDVCKAFDIGVTWDDKTKTIGIDTGDSYKD